MATTTSSAVWYGRFLLFIAGMGGLLYGIDVGIIAAALLYLEKTINLTVGETSIIVAAVLGGSMFSSLVAGVLADWFGRKTMLVVSGLMFVASVGLIVISQAFLPLFLGRLLQGMSGGVIAVVVPLYLAECLSAKTRGQGTAIFQFMLTFGIVVAALVGLFYTQRAESAIAAAAGNAELIKAAQNHAWRGMFLSVIYPGLIFFLGGFVVSESPRWLFRRGKKGPGFGGAPQVMLGGGGRIGNPRNGDHRTSSKRSKGRLRRFGIAASAQVRDSICYRVRHSGLQPGDRHKLNPWVSGCHIETSGHERQPRDERRRRRQSAQLRDDARGGRSGGQERP